MKQRIAILSAFATPLRSGAEACSEEVPSALKDSYDFVIITARMRRDLPKKDTLESGISMIRLGIGCRLDKWLFPFLAPLAAAKQHPKIIHAVLESYAGLALVFCRFTAPRAKRILTCQSTNTRLFVGLMHRAAHSITVISNTLVERAEKFGRTDVTLISNGLTLQNIPRASKVPGRILFVGRHEKMKGIDTLLRAFAKVLHRQPARLVIFGEGPLRAELEGLRSTLGLDGACDLPGHCTNLYSAMVRARLLVLSSQHEGSPNVLTEALACGCPVVSTDCPSGPRELLDGSSCGTLVPVADANSLASAIVDSLKKSWSPQTLKKHVEPFSAKRSALEYLGTLGYPLECLSIAAPRGLSSRSSPAAAA